VVTEVVTMTRTVGIRELKAKASEIVREVEESRTPVVITVRGREVARIVPSERKWTKEELADYWKGVRELAMDLGRHWPPGISAADAVSQDRDRL
jgi:prevent-host-death family protein